MKLFTPFITLITSCIAFNSQAALTLSSPDFTNNNKIPAEFTCQGKNISPALSWSGAPQNTQTFVLVERDPDAPMGTWVHWLLYNIPGSVHEIAQNSSAGTSGLNGWNKLGYGGPCPPTGVHHYIFTLYALDTNLNFPSKVKWEKIDEAMKAHILEKTELTGLYP
jgi:Raf kinase inhibitor-like YbhB/YbcL family protein